MTLYFFQITLTLNKKQVRQVSHTTWGVMNMKASRLSILSLLVCFNLLNVFAKRDVYNLWELENLVSNDVQEMSARGLIRRLLGMNLGAPHKIL